jgi:hypothetical protein
LAESPTARPITQLQGSINKHLHQRLAPLMEIPVVVPIRFSLSIKEEEAAAAEEDMTRVVTIKEVTIKEKEDIRFNVQNFELIPSIFVVINHFKFFKKKKKRECLPKSVPSAERPSTSSKNL